MADGFCSRCWVRRLWRYDLASRRSRMRIHGGSSLQALCLALALAKTLLDDFVEKGGQLTYDTGESFDLNAVFGITKH